MNNMKIFFLAFLIVFSVKTFSQSKDSTKVFIYEPFKSGKTIDTKNDIKVDKNCIKWNWSLIGRGVFALNYEHSITSKLSFELGAGLTYRDFLYEAGQGDDALGSDSKSYDVKLGPYVEGNLRFYPAEGDLEGFYLSPFLRYRSYNIKANMENSVYPAGYNITDIGFNIGIQRETWITGVMVESYFGVAYRYRSADRPYIDYSGTSNIVVQDKTQKWVPAITLGFKIGVPF